MEKTHVLGSSGEMHNELSSAKNKKSIQGPSIKHFQALLTSPLFTFACHFEAITLVLCCVGLPFEGCPFKVKRERSVSSVE